MSTDSAARPDEHAPINWVTTTVFTLTPLAALVFVPWYGIAHGFSGWVWLSLVFFLDNCLGGVPQTCTPGSPTSETCNGVDDDCDGVVDDEFVPTPTVCGTGACPSTGTTACVGGVVIDTCVPLPAETVVAVFGSAMTYHANISGPPDGQVLIQAGSLMKYLPNSSDPGIDLNWMAEAFDDTVWLGGPSGSPYGVGYENGPAPNAANLLQTAVPAGAFSVYTRGHVRDRRRHRRPRKTSNPRSSLPSTGSRSCTA